MKNFILTIVISMFGFTATAQEIRTGIDIGLPIGDSEAAYSLAFGVEIYCMWNISDEFDVGISAGFYDFLIKSEFSDFGESASFVPVAAAGRFAASEKFSAGADLGYAIGISPEGNDGGIYYRPIIGYNISEKFQITASYRGVSVDGGTFSSVNVGVNIGYN